MDKRILSGVVLLLLVGTSASAQSMAALNQGLFGPDDSLVTAALARVSASPETRSPRTVREASGAATVPAVANSFAALQSVLKVGQEVKLSNGIMDSELNGLLMGAAAGAGLACLRSSCVYALVGALGGGTIGFLVDLFISGGSKVTGKGKVVSISSNQLVIAQPPVWLPLFRRPEKRVFTEDVVRSIHIVDSTGNGAVIGGAVAAGFLGAGIASLGGMLFIVPAMILGMGIDVSMTRPVYERRSQAPRVTISPLLGGDQVGIMAQVHF